MGAEDGLRSDETGVFSFLMLIYPKPYSSIAFFNTFENS